MERQKQEYAPTYRRSMTQGVVLCVLAVVPILGTAMLGVPDFWVAAAVGLLLAIVAGAVQLFIRAGMTQGSFDKLLQTGEYTVREKWTNRRVGWFAGAYWCLVTAVYLAVSFWNNNWEKSWIIWAVAGLVFAASTLPSVRGQTGKIGKALTNSQFIHCNPKVVWYTQAKATQGGRTMTQNGIWLKKGLVPYHLNASELALALLVREKPLSVQQLSEALTEKGIRLDRKQLGKIGQTGTCRSGEKGKWELHLPECKTPELFNKIQRKSVVGYCRSDAAYRERAGGVQRHTAHEHQLPWQQWGLKIHTE